eukprot:TRINITY_DN20849_c0_g1_i1.p4 TRINITY_DN20849_c0_g1~~TRINITY_DN20849_c0_g1_i1.p4  ORF type:complete len:198 (-),score=-19.78 TRINITY_DN20849_c0_g1_i1:991-1584(-)
MGNYISMCNLYFFFLIQGSSFSSLYLHSIKFILLLGSTPRAFTLKNKLFLLSFNAHHANQVPWMVRTLLSSLFSIYIFCLSSYNLPQMCMIRKFCTGQSSFNFLIISLRFSQCVEKRSSTTQEFFFQVVINTDELNFWQNSGGTCTETYCKMIIQVYVYFIGAVLVSTADHLAKLNLLSTRQRNFSIVYVIFTNFTF